MHDEDNTYGAPRITAELNDGVPEGQRVNHKRVARVMRTHGIAGYRRRRRVRTTVADPADQKVPDLLKRDFTATRINTRNVGDITYLPLASGGNLYLATVIDCCSRRVTGWAIADHMRTELVADALTAAAALRGSLAGAVFHADHGSQYTSEDFAKLCADLGVTQSMGGVGSSAGNALAESFNATLKREILQDQSCWTGSDLPTRGLPMARPLQHQTTALPMPPFQPRNIRKELDDRYAARSRLTTNRVSTTWGQGPGLAVRKPEVMLGWLLAYVAATSTTASYATVLDAATAGVSDKPARSTTVAYRDVLTQLWLLDPVPAWGPAGNPLARLAQSPKHHLADPALAARLLGLSVDALLDGDGKPVGPQAGGMLGHLFESLVTLCVRVAAQAAEAAVGHLRTRNGDHEIDLVLVRDDGKVVAVEVKLSATVEDRDIAHVRWLADRLGVDLLDAVVVNTGPHAYRRSDGIGVVPLALLGP